MLDANFIHEHKARTRASGKHYWIPKKTQPPQQLPPPRQLLRRKPLVPRDDGGKDGEHAKDLGESTEGRRFLDDGLGGHEERLEFRRCVSRINILYHQERGDERV